LFQLNIIDDDNDLDYEINYLDTEDMNCEANLKRSKLNYPKNQQRKEYLQSLDLILWDEISAQNREDFDIAHSTLNKFKNKVIVLTGDFKQITPVVPFGNKMSILNSTIYTSSKWNLFEKHTFVKNLRLESGTQAEKDYEIFINSIGNNSYTSSNNINHNNIIVRCTDNQEVIRNKIIECVTDLNLELSIKNDISISTVKEGVLDRLFTKPNTFVHPAQYLCTDNIPSQLDMQTSNLLSKVFLNETSTTLSLINNIKTVATKKEVHDILFPNGMNNITDHNIAVLAATNKQVEQWNSYFQDLNTNQAIHFYSKDNMCEVDDPHNYLSKMIDNLVVKESFHDDTVPPYDLKLKLGDICILLRHVDRRGGLPNNTKVKIIGLRDNIITVSTINQNNPVIAKLPRYSFIIKMKYGVSYKLMRIQFPLRLAYALTMNKSQGQTLNKVVIDLTTPPFSHGHLYVALTRVTL
jgi:hypothetical protein